MQITLICQYETGSIACNADRIDGISVNERHYYIVNHQVVLEGNDSVVHHDVDELLGMDGMYRLPTLKEQDAIARAREEASKAQEQTLQASQAPATDTTPEASQAPATDTTPVAPKKTSG